MPASSKTATELSSLIGGYRLCARAEGKSKKTIQTVADSVGYLERFLRSEGLTTDLRQIGPGEIRAFILHLQRKRCLSDHPAVLQANVIVAFSQRAFDRHRHHLRRDGWLIVDSSQLTQRVTGQERVVLMPLAGIARELTGSSLSTNMVALGLMVGLTRLVSPKTLVAAMKKRSPRAELQANEHAIRRGMELAHSVKGEND